jgi:uncharacterized membrane protein
MKLNNSRKDRTNLGKKGNLSGMQGVLLALAFAAVTYLVTVIILGLGASLNNTLSVGQTGTALTVFNNGTLGFANIAQNLPTIATVIVIVVIIALLFLGFGGLLGGRGDGI